VIFVNAVRCKTGLLNRLVIHALLVAIKKIRARPNVQLVNPGFSLCYLELLAVQPVMLVLDNLFLVRPLVCLAVLVLTKLPRTRLTACPVMLALSPLPIARSARPVPWARRLIRLTRHDASLVVWESSRTLLHRLSVTNVFLPPTMMKLVSKIVSFVLPVASTHCLVRLAVASALVEPTPMPLV
jgi:hypothetical protein